MNITEDILIEKWSEVRGLVRERWGKLTDDDFARLSGKTEELVGTLRWRYGYGEVQARIEINNWLRAYDRRVKKKESLATPAFTWHWFYKSEQGYAPMTQSVGTPGMNIQISSFAGRPERVTQDVLF